MDKLFVAQPYQTGTSFSEITDGIKQVIANNEYNIEILEFPYENQSKVEGSLESAEEVELHIEVVRSLLRRKFSHALFLDFFCPGLDVMAFSRSLEDSNTKLGALIHGGTFVEGDIYDWPWLKSQESAWFEIYDQLYVPSRFLIEQIPAQYQHKVSIFPWGFDSVPSVEQKNWENRRFDIVFPHRLDIDKGIDDLLNIVDSLEKLKFCITVPQISTSGKYIETLQRRPNITIIFGENDEEHLNTLADSRVVLSTAKQENFGYAMLKATLAGCIPIVPDRLVYPEIFAEQFRYQSIQDAIRKIKEQLLEAKQQDVSSLQSTIRTFSFQPLIRHFYEK